MSRSSLAETRLSVSASAAHCRTQRFPPSYLLWTDDVSYQPYALLSVHEQEQQRRRTELLPFLLLRFRTDLRLQCFMGQLFGFVVVGELQNGRDLLQD